MKLEKYYPVMKSLILLFRPFLNIITVEVRVSNSYSTRELDHKIYKRYGEIINVTINVSQRVFSVTPSQTSSLKGIQCLVIPGVQVQGR